MLCHYIVLMEKITSLLGVQIKRLIIPFDSLLKLVHTVIFINVKPDPINPFF